MHEMQNDFQIVDHEIEDHTNVSAAFGVRRKPMRFNKTRMRQVLFECA
jgi:hypothetical protein